MTTTTTPIKPMQPIEGRIKDLVEGKAYIVQPKLRGIRAIWDPVRKALVTRKGRALTSVDHLIKAIQGSPLERIPLDGEIYVHGMAFKKISGLAQRKKSSEETAVLEFHVFDIAVTNITGTQRQIALSVLVLAGKFSPQIHRVRFPSCVSRDAILTRYETWLADGYEGIIIRDPEAPYTPGESKHIIKVKPLNDMEAELIGFEPAGPDSRNADTFGSLILQLANGATFKCSGIGDDDRAELWQRKPLGQPVTFMYDFIDEESGGPQGARYVEIRWDK